LRPSTGMKTKTVVYGIVLSLLLGTPALACHTHKKHHKAPAAAAAVPSPATTAG